MGCSEKDYNEISVSEKMQNEISCIFHAIFNLKSLSGVKIVYYVSINKWEAFVSVAAFPLYQLHSQLNISQAWLDLFTKKGRGMEQILPTNDALVPHLKRSVHQGGLCWGEGLKVPPNMPSPADHSWMDPNDWRLL